MANKYPVISLKEFDAMMQEGGFGYSVIVLAMLEEAAGYVVEAKHAETDYWCEKLYGLAYSTQVYALQTAEYEKASGKLAEAVLPVIAMVDENFARQIYEKWRGYLAKIGRKLPSIDEEIRNG